ncbi:MAG: FAD-binding oxidoreductase [Actinobacteria bacterium]|nr:FAD-binding oxidoreductase [Actinomycetota bacterium]MCL6105156.1 FAD-binding oxidoreductase [Actinomycetota bacterium]
MSRELLTGWGRTTPSAAEVLHPKTVAELTQMISLAGKRGIIARGLGRSYGDGAQCGGGLVVDTTDIKGVIQEDWEAGSFKVAAGTSLDNLIRYCLPHGWFLPVTPGTRFITVGGAVASDVHGKNHHKDGTFSRYVNSFTIVTPTSTLLATPDINSDIFWATAGGMGLTGILTEVTLSMIRIETAHMLVDIERTQDLDETMSKMEEGDESYRYSVAWLDCLATGKHLGRGILMRGDHAKSTDMSIGLRKFHSRHQSGKQNADTSLLEFNPTVRLQIPSNIPSGLLNRATVKIFNEIWFQKAPRKLLRKLLPLVSFFYPLDSLGNWNRLYGPAGFIQYQFVVPFGAAGELKKAIELIATSKYAAFLAVLKRFGPSGNGLLSFPMSGWTLALDIPLGAPGLAELLNKLDELIAGCEGRVYLTKDSRLTPELLPVMYPRLSEFKEIVKKTDPQGVFTSDLSRRLDLVSH